MTINTKAIINDFHNGMSLQLLSRKYKMTEKQIQAAIQKELHLPGEEQYREYERQIAEHNKKVNNEYSLAYDKLKSGNYLDALKLGLNATITMLFNAPQNPNLITGYAPAPMKWADVKSIISLIKSLKNLPQIISNLKNCKSIAQFKSFMTKLVQKLKTTNVKPAKQKKGVSGIKPNAKTQAQLIQEYSKGKNLIDMTDEELVLYYKKLIPDINKKELKYLIDQIHRIKKGEPRWLNTEEERTILDNIRKKQLKHNKEKGISYKLDEVENPTADIPFKKRELSEFQGTQLRGWYNKGEAGYLKPIFDDLATELDHDVILYRKIQVNTAYAGGQPCSSADNCEFLNSIKEGGIINNTNKYTSTAKSINNVQGYSPFYGQEYILKIKVPKGTKVLDMRNYSSMYPKKKDLDEIVLPPSSYKVNKINYTTGIIDCDFIPH